MKDFDAVIIFIICSLVACFVFFGIVKAVQKSFKTVPEPKKADYSKQLKTQTERVEENKRQLEQNRIDMRQKMQDYRNRTR